MSQAIDPIGPISEPANVTLASKTADVSIPAACGTAETELMNATFETGGTPATTLVIDALVRVRNNAGAVRTSEFRIKRGGSSCADAAAVESDGFAKETLAAGPNGFATVSWRNSEASPQPWGTQTIYRLCGCIGGAGTLTSEYARITFLEFRDL